MRYWLRLVNQRARELHRRSPLERDMVDLTQVATWSILPHPLPTLQLKNGPLPPPIAMWRVYEVQTFQTGAQIGSIWGVPNTLSIPFCTSKSHVDGISVISVLKHWNWMLSDFRELFDIFNYHLTQYWNFFVYYTFHTCIIASVKSGNSRSFFYEQKHQSQQENFQSDISLQRLV